MRNLFRTLLVITVLVSFGMAAVMIAPYGVSPRKADMDAGDIFTKAYNGMLNVGNETQMYFMVMGDSVDFTPSYAVTGPAGSVAAVTTDSTIDGTTYIASFMPDVVGTYTITANGMGMVTVFAGTYAGNSCEPCHSAVRDEWTQTRHAIANDEGLDGIKSDHYAAYCLPCHTTGYDASADNGGFDDWGFVFPDSQQLADWGHDGGHLFVGAADSLRADFPDAMARSNIQCESCHGPKTSHVGVEINPMEASLDVAVCAKCHDSGWRHLYPNQWEYSGHDATEFDGRGFHGGHAVGAFVGYAGGRNGCSPCHSGSGYIQWVNEGRPVNDDGLPAATSFVPEPSVISCAVCHDPHSSENENQLRVTPFTLGDGTPVSMELYGAGAQCMDCHRSRRFAADYALNPNNNSSHFGPHHGPQADMILGANMPDFGMGVELPTSPHALTGGACVDCHMGHGDNYDENYNVKHVGGHSFNMNDAEGNDNVEACAPCHGDVGTSFTEKKFFMNGDADHDGDGVAEGVQEEVHGLMEILHAYLLDDEGNFVLGNKSITPELTRALYNYMWVEEDRSFGIHNPAFTVSLLKLTIQTLEYEGITAGEILDVMDIPMDQGNQVRVIWTRFGADDHMAWDKVNMYTVLREVPVPGKSNVTSYPSVESVPTTVKVGDNFAMGGHLWDVVGVVPAVGFMEYSMVVPTLHNTVEGDTAWAAFKILGATEEGMIAETAPVMGFSTDDIAPGRPNGLNGTAAETALTISWEESLERDFGYYEVYRTTDPNNWSDKPVETTIATEYIDTDFELNTIYYYTVTAVDVHKNRSEFSEPVDLVFEVVGIEEIPTEFALKQNYPNPFNPTTSISFQLPEQANVTITIYNSLGAAVTTLVNGSLDAGNYSYTWNAAGMASGIYYYRMVSDNFTSTKKMLLLK